MTPSVSSCTEGPVTLHIVYDSMRNSLIRLFFPNELSPFEFHFDDVLESWERTLIAAHPLIEGTRYAPARLAPLISLVI